MRLSWFALILIAYLLIGCGANLSMELPNDHTLAVSHSNSVGIISDITFGQVVAKTIDSLNTEGDYVFGIRLDPETLYFADYFILDTTKSSTEYYAAKIEWEAALAQLGITDVELRGPSAFFNWHDQIWWRVSLLVMAVFAIVIPTWLIRRARTKELEIHLIRQNQP